MQPYELIRRAAKLIETQGWACGTDEAGDPVAARDASGNPVRLLSAGTGGESRVKVNKAAVSFSAYGALVKAQELYKEPTSVGLMWSTLYAMAKDLHNAAEGGTNYVHPVIQFNETEGRTKEEVLAFMEAAAAAIEAQLAPVAS